MTGDNKGSSSVETKEELSGLFEDVSSKKEKGVIAATFDQPAGPIGFLGVCTASYFMARALGVGQGNKLDLSSALQKRVLAQFGTVVALIGGFLYWQRTHTVELEKKRHERELMNKYAWDNYAKARYEEEHPK